LTSLQTTGLPLERQSADSLGRLFASFDLVFLNRDAARQATGSRGGARQLVQSSLDLVSAGAPKGLVILTLGEDGALVIPKTGEPTHVPAVSVGVVDTTGAGDAFAGAFLAAWLSGADATAAARYGVAAGSLMVSVEGAQGVTPSAGELADLVAALPAGGVGPDARDRELALLPIDAP
jgi:sugar/nucleoside kinase (ribokinase family)